MFQASSTATAGKRGFSAVHPASHPTQEIYKDGQDKVTQPLNYAAGLNGNIVVLQV
jgi:hypothetical protein